VLSNQQATMLNRLFSKYLSDNAAVFAERLELIKERSMDNDQIYADREIFRQIQKNNDRS